MLMPNYLVFNNSAQNLRTTIYGADGSAIRPVAVDSNGDFLFSPLSVISVTATNLDIRPLTTAEDSVVVTATNLDIRDLSGTQDSVQIYSERFVEDTTSTSVPNGTTYLLTKDISAYRENSYFIRNISGASITITLQIAPVDSDAFYVNNSTPQAVAVSANNITSVTTAMKFARLKGRCHHEYQRRCLLQREGIALIRMRGCA